MNDRELIKSLNALGIDADSYRVIALLPLVQVAWSDGVVQPAEGALIRRIAREQWRVGPAAEHLVEDWIAFRPSGDYLARGQRVLRELIGRSRGLSLDAADHHDVLTLSRNVAAVAGGLFGFGAVSAVEEASLSEIAGALSVSNADWNEALAEVSDVDEDGEPITDRFEINPAARARLRLDDEHQTLSETPAAASGRLIQADGSRQWVVQQRIAIGRSRTNEVQIPADAQASRHHAMIAQQAGDLWLQDLGSENGTFVNGARVTRRQLFGGEEIVFGSSGFQFVS